MFLAFVKRFGIIKYMSMLSGRKMNRNNVELKIMAGLR